MKKNILFLILVMVFLISGCSTQSDAPEFYDETNAVFQTNDSGDTTLTEEYQSYINSVQSQLNKKYKSEFQYNYITDMNVKEKKYSVNFIESETGVSFNCECVRNNIQTENYLKAKASYTVAKDLEKKITLPEYMTGIDIDKQFVENAFNVSFEVLSETDELSENYMEDPSVKKMLKIVAKSDYLQKISCDNVFFSNVGTNLKKIANNEFRDAENLKIYQSFPGCGTVILTRNNEDNFISINKANGI